MQKGCDTVANLTAVFELVDRIGDKLDAIANRGDEAVGKNPYGYALLFACGIRCGGEQL